MAKKKDEKKEHSVEVTFVLSKIEKCLKLEEKVRKQKYIDLYRELGVDSILALEELGYSVETHEAPIGGVYHSVAWE